MGLTVREALRLGALEKATLVAGHAGLDREIRHVSVIEVPDAHHWFRGHELWLTAFYTLKDNTGAQLEMLEHMNLRQSAGLVVCYPRRYGPGVAPEVVAKADELAFPLLHIPDDVAYIEVIYPIYREIVERQACELEYALRVHDQMSALILENKGLGAIARSLSELVGNPVSVHDEHMGLLELESADAGLFGAKLQELVTAGKLPVPVLEVERDSAPTQETFVNLPDGGEIVTLLARPIRVGHAVHGWMVVWLGNPGPHRWLRVSLERACNVAALHLAKERAVLETERRVQRDFLDDVLFGNIKSEAVLLARGQAVGWNLASKHRVLVVQCDASQQDGSEGEAGEEVGAFTRRAGTVLAEVVRQAGPRHVMVPRSDWAVVMLDGSDAEESCRQARALARSIREALEGALASTVSIGIGSYQRRPTELWRSYEDARRAISLGRKVYGPGNIVTIDEVKAFELLETVAGTPRGAELVAATLAPLVDYDRRHHTELVTTLETYFACRESASLTAARLFIHRNTLAYRLGKIHEVLGVDPCSERERFRFILAFALRRLA